MVMDTLVCYLLALCFAVAQTEKGPPTTTPTTAAPQLNLAYVTSNSTVQRTDISHLTESTTPFPSMDLGNDTSTETMTATAESSSRHQASQSTTTMTPTAAALTTAAMHTTIGYRSTPDSTGSTPDSTGSTPDSTGSTPDSTGSTPDSTGRTPDSTGSTPDSTGSTHDSTGSTLDSTGSTHDSTGSTPDSTGSIPAYSSHTVNTTADMMYRTTHGLGLHPSEKYMTIIFSVVLGVFVLALVAFMFHRCKHKIQYLHQPLDHTDDTADAFVPDDDTLVISGGLYDGHPIYDNIPTSEDRSQFRLEFLH